jgi:hypothetical protein
MSALPILEVAIGLSFTYLLLALITTTLTEWITRLFDSRGKMLRQALEQLLDEEKPDAALTDAILAHPLVSPFSQKRPGGRRRKPSYLSADLFATTLTRILATRSGSGSEGGASSVSPRLLEALSALAPGLAEGLLPDNATIARWYEEHMERVSGWYKRHSQTIVLFTAVALTVLLNADSVTLARHLWSDSALRAAVVESAKVRLQQGPPLQPVEYIDPTTPKPTAPVTAEPSPNSVIPEEQELLERLFGWTGEAGRFAAAPWIWTAMHLLGWLLTALAVSLGAPFWFDTLNRFMNIRSSGPAPADPKNK